MHNLLSKVHIQFVESMLDVHHKYSELIKEVFRVDQAFITALDKACSAVINHRPVPRQPARAPELVGNFVCISVFPSKLYYLQYF